MSPIFLIGNPAIGELPVQHMNVVRVILLDIKNETFCMDIYAPIRWLELVKVQWYIPHQACGTPSDNAFLTAFTKRQLIIFLIQNYPKIAYSTWKNLPSFSPT